MSNFILNNTAEEVNSAITKVTNATATPLDANPNMVTSGGVKVYVDTQLSSLDPRLTTVESDITTLQSEKPKVATYSRIANIRYTSSQFIPFTEDSDPDNIGTVLSSGAVRVGAGLYLVNLQGEFLEEDSDIDDYFTLYLRSSGTTIYNTRINETGSNTYRFINNLSVLTIPASSTKDLDLYFQETSSTIAYSKNVVLTLVKLS